MLQAAERALAGHQGGLRGLWPFLGPAFIAAVAYVDPGMPTSRSASRCSPPALVVSQVVLSFGIPFALIPLVLFSRDRELMGGLVNARLTTIAAVVVAALIISLNFVLLYLTFVG